MTEIVVGRRASRRVRSAVDLTLFSDDIEAAMVAFSEDVTYAVLMARSAVTIGNKRRVWQARKELRDAA